MKLKAKITKRSAEALNSIDGKEARPWDTELNGFCVRALVRTKDIRHYL